MIPLRQESDRTARSRIPWRAILSIVLATLLLEVVHVLTLEESIYAQDAPIPVSSDKFQADVKRAQPSQTSDALESDKRSIRIVAIYGPTSVRVGELANYRVRLADGAKRPVIYRWRMGDGTLAEGNNVAHRFARSGRFQVIATVRNKEGMDADTLTVAVAGNVIVPVPETEVARTVDLRSSSDLPSEPLPRALDKNVGTHSKDGAFRGNRPLSWSAGAFTLLVATSSDRKIAETTAVDLRRRGLRSGIYLDDTGFGSAVYRVVVGEFAGENEAVRGRRVLLGEGHRGAFIVHPMPQE